MCLIGIFQTPISKVEVYIHNVVAFALFLWIFLLFCLRCHFVAWKKHEHKWTNPSSHKMTIDRDGHNTTCIYLRLSIVYGVESWTFHLRRDVTMEIQTCDHRTIWLRTPRSKARMFVLGFWWAKWVELVVMGNEAFVNFFSWFSHDVKWVWLHYSKIHWNTQKLAKRWIYTSPFDIDVSNKPIHQTIGRFFIQFYAFWKHHQNDHQNIEIM